MMIFNNLFKDILSLKNIFEILISDLLPFYSPYTGTHIFGKKA